MAAQQSLTDRLKTLTEKGTLKRDAAQLEVASRLDAILDELAELPAEAKPAGKLKKLFGLSHKPDGPLVKGLYVHGSVGRGKTMLMDMFFELAPLDDKRRAHFLVFMADVQNRINDYRRRLKAGEVKEPDP